MEHKKVGFSKLYRDFNAFMFNVSLKDGIFKQILLNNNFLNPAKIFSAKVYKINSGW